MKAMGGKSKNEVLLLLDQELWLTLKFVITFTRFPHLLVFLFFTFCSGETPAKVLSPPCSRFMGFSSNIPLPPS